MLAGCAESLVEKGWRVVLPSRRYVPIPARDDTHSDERRALWVAANWSEPETLASKAAKALDGPGDLLVAWVHDAYRDAVLRAIAGLLAPGAPVVEVHGSDELEPIDEPPNPVLDGHPTQQVVLGRVTQGGGRRWLTHAEIVDGVRQAIDRALAGKPPAVIQVGE
ncbi:MAG: hypothetical protein J2O49_01200 [Sciscionella sp.]|nr:hypothetical protein [Sciscionella sp.]